MNEQWGEGNRKRVGKMQKGECDVGSPSGISKEAVLP